MPTRAKSRESTQSDRVDNAAQTEPVDTEEEDESTAPLDAAVLHEINVVLRDHREDMMHLLREEAEQRERLVQLSSSLSMLPSLLPYLKRRYQQQQASNFVALPAYTQDSESASPSELPHAMHS